MSASRVSIAFVFALALPACGSPQSPNATSPTKPATTAAAPVATDLDRLNAVDLPSALNTSPLFDEHVPVVTVTGHEILCDGEVVGDTRAIRSAGKLQRIDGLWENLKHARESWKDAHIGHAFPGVALFAFDRKTPAVVVKSVFQTAAYAAYPNAQFAVRKSLHAVARINVDAMVPFPNAAPPPLRDGLLVGVQSAKYDLVWRRGDTDVATVNVASAHDLPDAITKLVAQNSTHQKISDRVIDQAVLYVSDDVDYAGIIGILDALEGPMRDIVMGQTTLHLPVLNVSLAMAKDPPAVDPGH